MVQVGLPFIKEGVGAFGRITNELKKSWRKKDTEPRRFPWKLRYID